MLRTRLLPLAITCAFALAEASSAMALPVAPGAASKAAASSYDSSKVQIVRFGGRGGGFHGGRGFVAHRGYGFHGGGMRYGGRYAGGRYGYGRYGYGRHGYRWGAAAAATGLGVAAATSPYWYGGYGSNCGPYQYYQPGYGCVNQ